MKILTKEEEQAHYNATVKGGAAGGGLGLLVVCPSLPIQSHKANISQGWSCCLRRPAPLPHHPPAHPPHESLPRHLLRHLRCHYLCRSSITQLRNRPRPLSAVPGPRHRRPGAGPAVRGHVAAGQGLGPREPLPDRDSVVGGVAGRGVQHSVAR